MFQGVVVQAFTLEQALQLALVLWQDAGDALAVAATSHHNKEQPRHGLSARAVADVRPFDLQRAATPCLMMPAMTAALCATCCLGQSAMLD
jgi:hypothetical protein